jgi:hypothetical protein
MGNAVTAYLAICECARFFGGQNAAALGGIILLVAFQVSKFQAEVLEEGLNLSVLLVRY